MPTDTQQQELYSPWVGLVFVFNLIVGTGALTLPAVFAETGWLLSSILIISLALFGFITVTFIIESMACANATIYNNLMHSHKFDWENDDMEDATEKTAILPNRPERYYTLARVELSRIATLYFNKTGRILFFISLCIYLYGDLSIYAAAVAKTLSDIACNTTNLTDEDFTQPCIDNGMSRMDMYRIFVLLFIGSVGPFAYFNVQKTKYLQVITSTMRWIAFTIMIAIAIGRIMKMGKEGNAPAYNFSGVPALLGASVYSFMCHHSLPALVAPFNDKKYVTHLIGLDYILICSFYILLALTGSFAFANVADLYTLNFAPTVLHMNGAFVSVIECFLVLFPVFTLSTSFPIIAITLQSNLQSVFIDVGALERYGFLIRRVLFPTLAVIPPTIIALLTHNLRFLVEFTGCFAGAVIQYVVPALLVGAARRSCARELNQIENKFASPFKGDVWIIVVLGWSIVCILLVIVNFFDT